MAKKIYNNVPKEDLLKQLIQLEDQLRKLKFQVSANQLKDVREIREVKKEVARIKTSMNSKTL